MNIAKLFVLLWSLQMAVTAAPTTPTKPTAISKPVTSPIKPPPTAPTKPTPTKPAPTKPAPTKPAPTKPAPTKPAPTKPAPTKPAPTKPAPTKPAPTKPAPTKPAPTKPAPTKPAPTKPAPTKPAPTKPAPTKPAPTKPAPTKPAPTKPAPTKPAPTKPSSGFVNLEPFPANTLFSISTDKTSYTFNSTVTVSYTSVSPRRDDFIAIFPISTPLSRLTKGLFWLWTCNQQGNVCSTAKGKGSVVFGPKGPPSAWSIHWPLPAGQYRAYMVRDAAKPPYTAIAQSKVFTVVQTFDEALAGAKKMLTAMIKKNTNLVPQFLRLIFHDCVGGCDGCIDMTNHDNSGILSTINVLTVVTDAFANNSTGLSRADAWSLAAIVATDLADKGRTSQKINFTFDWFGRVDCENANKVCFNSSKKVVPCSKIAGPHRDIPGPNLNTTGFFSFFDKAFGFNKQQAVAAMGAHSVGRLFRENSGIDGPDGWQINNQHIRSEYYEALLGSATAKSNASEILVKSPKWDHIFLNNTKFNRPNRHFWRLNVSGKVLTMLNADIAMVRDLNNKNMNPVTGKVSCAFNPSLGERPLCPLAGTVSIVQKFLNNDAWLKEFKSVLDLISTNGYIRKACAKPPCRLGRKTTQ